MIIDNILGLSKINVDSKDYMNTEHPIVFVRDFLTTQNIGKNILIKYYVSDYNNSDWIKNEYNSTFTVEIEINGRTYKKTTYAGESSIVIDGINTEGEYIYSIRAIDQNGISSPTQFFKILITDETITESDIYIMRDSDLSTYSITTGNITDVETAKQNKTGLTNLFSAIKNDGYKQITLKNATYMVDYHGDNIVFPSDFTIDLNGSTIKVLACTDLNGGQVALMKNCKNTHIINGNIYGNADVFNADATKANTKYNVPGEWLSVIDMQSCSYCSYEDINVKYPVGYNLDFGMASDKGVSDGYLTFEDNTYIDTNGEAKTTAKSIATSDFKEMVKTKQYDLFKVARYLGYSGFSGNNPVIYVHFYDDKKTYIKTVKSRQYLDIKNVTNAKYIRVTAFGTAESLKNQLVLHGLGSTYNCYVKNCSFSNSRTCLFHPTICNNIAIENCTFENVCTEILKYPVTTMVADFEDGWLNCQNVFARNNSLKKDDVSIVMAITGWNFNFEKNNGFSYTIRDGIFGLNINGNMAKSFDLSISDVKYKQNFILVKNSCFTDSMVYRYSGSANMAEKIERVAYKALTSTSQNVTVIKNKSAIIN